MLKINFLTLFPKYYNSFINESIVGRAIERKLINIDVIDWRNFANGKQRQVDDIVFGSGKGMLLMLEPIVKALKTITGHKVLVSPQGKVFNQKMAREWVKTHKEITFIAGRYEGFDERILNYVDEEISLGDFIVTGGELPAMIMADACIRLWPDVIHEESHQNESFSENLFDFPQYTRPRVFEGHEVPEVLLSGHFAKIKQWRREQQIAKTKKIRPDLYERFKNEK